MKYILTRRCTWFDNSPYIYTGKGLYGVVSCKKPFIFF